MGYQLWTSPITGYRRTGTRFSELRELLGARITASAILEPLQSCPASATAAEMQRALELKEFDIAGVQEEPDGPVVGFVEKKDLVGGIVRDHLKPLRMEKLISDGTPLSGVLSTLKLHPYSFVLIGTDIRGIVARTDANKPPVRVYLFGLISLLEMHLRYWVRTIHAGDSWQRFVAEQRVNKAIEQQTLRRQKGEEVELIDCLQFCDKREILVKSDEAREVLLISDSKAVLDRRFKKIEDLRNLLAHSQSDIVEGSSWEERIELIEWMEELVARSDQIVEKHAIEKASGGFSEELWS